MSLGYVVLLPILLLIVGSLAIYFAPAGVKFRKAAAVPAIGVGLPLLLMFYTMMFSARFSSRPGPMGRMSSQQPPISDFAVLPAAGQIALPDAPASPLSETKPAWVGTAPQSLPDAYQTVVVVGPFTTREECEAQLPAAVQEALDDYLALCLGEKPSGRVAFPPNELLGLVKEQWAEVGQYLVGPMIRLHALVRFDLKFKERVLEECQRVAVTRRLYLAGGGWLAAMVVLAAVYVGLRRRGMRDEG
jgi:hypothetical protein